MASIIVHDFSGHAFTVQLARWLSQQGHAVEYWYCADIESPHGNLVQGPGETLVIKGISVGAPVGKYSPLQRARQEMEYGRRAAALLAALKPDVILSNAPPVVQKRLLRAAKSQGSLFILWLQDIYSSALAQLVKRKSALLAKFIATAARWYEYSLMRASDRVVCISEDFLSLCAAHGVPEDKLDVVRNWATLEEIPVLPKDNVWSRRHGLHDKFVFLFSGTLGLKHDPSMLLGVAEALRDVPETRVVIVSQGKGRDWLERKKRELGFTNLLLFDYQPHENLPMILATADVLTPILEPFAGELSVPSKVLAYLCAGRTIVAAMPEANLATRIVQEAGAGIVVPAGDRQRFVAACLAMMQKASARLEYEANGRAYAERAFDIAQVGGRFLDIFAAAQKGRGRRNVNVLYITKG
ncbi:MAG TPA: glycosyltransferase family 4 protein [Rhizorhapis sp.]|nr:glycosyltransferase family 4 protein [Rhizorhapis sp.]